MKNPKPLCKKLSLVFAEVQSQKNLSILYSAKFRYCTYDRLILLSGG